jgi:hypothetical protein
MSDIQKQAQIDAAVASSVTMPSRRKLIRLGAAAVPVVATLTSQSALATNCVSGSAWGSDQVSGSASQAARHNSRAVPVSTGFRISAWNAARPTTSGNVNSAPWIALRAKYAGAGQIPANFNQNTITYGYLAALDPTRFKTPVGFSASTPVVGSLGNDEKSYFAAAQLNFAAGQKPPTQCITDADWALIVAGTFPPAPATAWDLALTARYLKNNFIVQV